MAGTPTQYYGFPTYADSDAVDLTAQYNTAMANIDSELHQLDTFVHDRTDSKLPKLVVCGDSWSDAVGSWYSWLDYVNTSPVNTGIKLDMYDIHSYAVSGSNIEGIASQIAVAVQENPYTGNEYLVALGGTNSYSANSMRYSEVTEAIRSAIVPALAAGYPYDRIFWVANGPNVDHANFGNIVSMDIPAIVRHANVFPCPIYFDVYYAMIYQQSLYTNDNLHPNQNGAIQISTVIKNLLAGRRLANNLIAGINNSLIGVHINGNTMQVRINDEAATKVIASVWDGKYATMMRALRHTYNCTNDGTTITVTGPAPYLML